MPTVMKHDLWAGQRLFYLSCVWSFYLLYLFVLVFNKNFRHFSLGFVFGKVTQIRKNRNTKGDHKWNASLPWDSNFQIKIQASCEKKLKMTKAQDRNKGTLCCETHD
mmetsp:Transcript_4278/g.12294  ORF Transcript_4278/g.12294 Transcript_4278/m.12294 type:complete len:107 (-) Transcript_4278:9620-9940(-)